jgi:hypothetical protein
MDDLAGEVPFAEWGDDQAAACIGGIGLGMAPGTERRQPVEIEVRAPLGALDDVVDVQPGRTQQFDEMRCCGLTAGLKSFKSTVHLFQIEA